MAGGGRPQTKLRGVSPSRFSGSGVCSTGGFEPCDGPRSLLRFDPLEYVPGYLAPGRRLELLRANRFRAVVPAQGERVAGPPTDELKPSLLSRSEGLERAAKVLPGRHLDQSYARGVPPGRPSRLGERLTVLGRDDAVHPKRPELAGRHFHLLHFPDRHRPAAPTE